MNLVVPPKRERNNGLDVMSLYFSCGATYKVKLITPDQHLWKILTMNYF